jgi:hypothetical protein
MEVYIKKYISEDIFKSLKLHKSEYNIDDKTFEKICKMRIKKYMKQIKLKDMKIIKHYSSINMIKTKNRCKCRLWSDGYESRCSNKIITDDLCKTHYNMFKKYGNLRFGKIDDIKPTHDLIKGNILPWKEI